MECVCIAPVQDIFGVMGLVLEVAGHRLRTKMIQSAGFMW